LEFDSIFYDICLGLGSNIGRLEDNLLKAIDLVKKEMTDIAVMVASNVYSSSPVGNVNQPDFLNCVILFRLLRKTGKTQGFIGTGRIFAERLLLILKNIEKNMGRKNETERYMPRDIDIDILFIYDNFLRNFVNLELPELKLPHPEVFNRKFVLYPMLDLSISFKKPFDEESIKKALITLKNLDIGVSQKIFCYGKFDKKFTKILR